MQEITQVDIKKFQALYKRHFDVVLSDDDARAQLALLILQIKLIYKPIRSE